MALKATIFKLDLDIADMDRHYYISHALTLARHPSETDERMMARIVAFALNADDTITFTRGLSADDEPALWKKDLTGAIDQWIEVGLPDERRLRKASGRSRQVIVYAFGGRTADIWWEKSMRDFRRMDNLTIYTLSEETTTALETLAQRTMRLSCTIQEGDISLSDGETIVPVSFHVLLQSAQ
ncbi:MAG: YaeQ family protein [Halothiobacillus sp.]|jgi:uncharacterized protein YaeQ|nr:YaeQ family protein [Halothiobacillus sp.]